MVERFRYLRPPRLKIVVKAPDVIEREKRPSSCASNFLLQASFIVRSYLLGYSIRKLEHRTKIRLKVVQLSHPRQRN